MARHQDEAARIQAEVAKVPPAVYTSAVYRMEFALVRTSEGRACWELRRDGHRLEVSYDDTLKGWWTKPSDHYSSLRDARDAYRSILFHEWDRARIKALGGISDTVRYNARQDEWEKIQTFEEKLHFPGQQQLRRALAARRQADEATTRAAQATRHAVDALAAAGLSGPDIAALLGLSRMRISQIRRQRKQ